jgi:hypothetical protein
MSPVTTKELKEMSIDDLTLIADMIAAKITFLSESGKDEENPEQYKRMALELYHLSEIIEEKELNLKTKTDVKGKAN